MHALRRDRARIRTDADPWLREELAEVRLRLSAKQRPNLVPVLAYDLGRSTFLGRNSPVAHEVRERLALVLLQRFGLKAQEDDVLGSAREREVLLPADARSVALPVLHLT